MLFFISLLIGVHSSLNIIEYPVSTFKNLFSLESEAIEIFTFYRLPRTLAIVLSAGSLSISGLLMQSIGRNKFLSPTTSGTTNFTQLGLLFVLLYFPSFTLIPKFIFAFMFSLLGTLLFIAILNKIKVNNLIYVPLIGMLFGGIISAVVTFVANVTATTQWVQALNVGSYTMIVKGNYELLYLVLIPFIIAIIYSTKFNIVSLGEDFSTNLGVNYKKTVFVGLIIISVIVSTTYIVVGPIPFLGLIIPNIMTLFYGDNIKKNLFDLSLLGINFVLFSDILGRVINYPLEIPISLIAGVIGSAVFLFLLMRRVKNG